MDGIALPHLKDGDVELTADDLQLRDGGGTVHVAGHEQRALAELAAHEPRELGSRSSSYQRPAGRPSSRRWVPWRRWRFCALEPPMSFVSSSLTIFTTCWAGVRLSSTSAPTAALGDLRHEVLDDLVAHVGLEQGQTHLPHGRRVTSASVRRPLPRRRLKVWFSFSLSPSNAMGLLL